MTTYEGTFFDGLSAKKFVVGVELGAASLALDGPEIDRPVRWPVADLRAVRKARHGQAVELNTATQPDARLIIDDPVFASALLARAPHLRKRRGYTPRAWERPWAVAAIMVAFIATVILTVPLLAAPLAQMVPDTWRTSMGTSTERMVLSLGPQCIKSSGAVALNKLVIKLAPTSEEDAPPISVKVIQGPLTNAFALPGGKIIVFQKLLDVMEAPDEFAGVLAHEIGHVVERHPTEATLRSMGFSLFLTMLVGDSSALTEFLASLGIQAVESSYSRDHERTADRVAVDLLAAAGADPGKMARTFERLRKAQKEEGTLELGRLGALLSTHPPYDERIETARAQMNKASQSLLTDSEWRALKNICDPPEPELSASLIGDEIT